MLPTGIVCPLPLPLPPPHPLLVFLCPSVLFSPAYPLSNQTDVFLMCFSVISPSSFENITIRWHPELQHHCPGTPCVLVGTKIDLRDDEQVNSSLESQGLSVISKAQGDKCAKEIGCECYVECSALTQDGLKEVFDKAARYVVGLPVDAGGEGGGEGGEKGEAPKKPKKKKKGCTLI
jgi:Ras family